MFGNLSYAGSTSFRLWKILAALALALPSIAIARQGIEERDPCVNSQPMKQPFFGDLHVHTRYSLDASTQGTRTTPAQAYRFATGEKIGIQPWTKEGDAQRSLQLRQPLDFAMVSDHAELIGEVQMCNSPQIEGYNSWQCRLYRYWPRGAYYLFNYNASMRQTHLGMCGTEGELCLQAALQPWQEMQHAAQKYYDRSEDCSFTTFVGYEWTGVDADSGGNLHRNIVFRNADVPELPISFIDAPYAQALWRSLDERCNNSDGRCESLIIPHNSNLSAGVMFSGRNDSGGPMTADYAAARARHEPLVEVMQHKGASECYFEQGVTEDELCAFEQLPKDNIAGFNNPPTPDTGFVRQVLADGVAIEQRLGVNPYQFGLIASTDTHLGAPGAAQEDRFLGHGGAGMPAREEVPPGLPDKLSYNPGGLAVLWAEENTRESLFAAMQARETYATSGPRIISRLFGGWQLPADLCTDTDRVEQAYASGVPMGSVLPVADDGDATPQFLVMAAQSGESGSNPLQKVQIIKSWIDATGHRREQVIDVAGNPNPEASVDERTCNTSGSGFAELCAVWSDEGFDPRQSAFYYSRVVENPSCRWSQRICIAAGVDCSDPATITEGYQPCCEAEHRPVIQERAWSSPIWYTPQPAVGADPYRAVTE